MNHPQRTKMMRSFSLLTVIFCFFSLSSHAALLKMNVSSTPIQVGNSVSVDLVLTQPFAGITNGVLAAFGFNLDFDDSALTLANTLLASDWSDDSAFYANTDLAASHFPGVSDTGQSEILLATFMFTANSVGDFIFKVSSDSQQFLGEQGLFFFDENFDSITFDATANATISAVSQVSEPSAMLLLLVASGFIVRRKLKA
ncbi:PEP-CTERM sorting domain-containing protein [Paraglaciecola sp.]|uniref:PEP-CTERM sorting domain-containing protein n=1 Tax=Paraglaciecola sp. TaxID=1920173 RepID=UPI0030F44BCB